MTDHALYLTITSRGAIRIVPVRQANMDGEQNEYHRTKEIGLIAEFRRMGAPVHRPGEPLLQGVFLRRPVGLAIRNGRSLKPAKIFQLAFRDKGRLVDSPEHPLFKKWAARDSD